MRKLVLEKVGSENVRARSNLANWWPGGGGRSFGRKEEREKGRFGNSKKEEGYTRPDKMGRRTTGSAGGVYGARRTVAVKL